MILCEEAYTVGLAMGINGRAMDYILYPGQRDLPAGGRFRAYIRHVFLVLSEGEETQTLERLYREFETSHAGVKGEST